MRRAGISEISEQPASGHLPPRAGDGGDTSAIRLTPDELRILDGWLAASDTPKTVARRATIIREAASGRSNSEIARELGVSRGTVILWRQRFAREGLLSLSEIRPGRGRRRSVSTRTVRAIVEAARRGHGAAGGLPSCRALAESSGVSAATVYRVCDAHGVHANARIGSELPCDGAASEIVVGVYLEPPDRVIVLRRDRGEARRSVRMELSPSLVRALDRFDRSVVGPCVPRDRERAFLKFLRRIERATPSSSSLVLLLDAKGGTYRRAGVRRWLEARPRVEVRIVRDKDSTAALLGAAIVRRSSKSSANEALRALLEDVRAYLALYDGEPDRFAWIASSDSTHVAAVRPLSGNALRIAH